jgi:N-methylhydantoinase B
MGTRKIMKEIEPYLMVVLARKFESVTTEMNNALLRAARSNVMATARDFSCSITDQNHGIVCVAGGNANHVVGSGLVARVMTELHDDIRPGDAFLNNSPYYGNNHHADWTISVPVFYKGEHIFTANARAHQADCGNSQPTTYSPFCKDVYEEGALDFPSVRIQKDYKDIEDLIRMCRVRIRVPDQWYGDYLAMVGAARVGERRIIELFERYGVDTIKVFAEQWQEYGKRRMIEEIRKLPNGTWQAEAKHDPVPGVAEDGIMVKLKMTIDPDEGYIILDFTGSADTVPGGYNMSEGSIVPASSTGVLNNLDPTLPKNEGVFGRIKRKLRKNCVAGIVEVPASASVATTNVAGRMVNLVQSTFGQLGENKGMAEGALGMAASMSVISGFDWRTNRPYVNQLIQGTMGGPGLFGHDGWITYNLPEAGGTLMVDSIEVNEQKYPIIYDESELIPDSGGGGRWRGAPGVRTIIRQRRDAGVWAYTCDGHFLPAKGIHGGQAGRVAHVWKFDRKTKKRIDLPTISYQVITPEEAIVSESGGGGGFGDPLDRDAEKVRWDVIEGFITVEKAREVYRVVLGTDSEQYAVNQKATEELRRELKKESKA